MRSAHDAVQIWILVGCSSRLMARVAPEKCSMATGMCCGLIQIPIVQVGPEFGAAVQQVVVSETINREIGSTAAANPHGERGHPCPCHCGNRHDACSVWDTVAMSRRCCARLCSTARLETASRSRATRSREASASAQYWMDFIILLAPSGKPHRGEVGQPLPWRMVFCER